MIPSVDPARTSEPRCFESLTRVAPTKPATIIGANARKKRTACVRRRPMEIKSLNRADKNKVRYVRPANVSTRCMK